MIDGKEYAFIGRARRDCIGASIGTFFSDFLMALADMPARGTEVSGAAAKSVWISRVVTALVPTFSCKVVAGNTTNGPTTGAGSDKRIVINGKKTIALTVGTKRLAHCKILLHGVQFIAPSSVLSSPLRV